MNQSPVLIVEMATLTSSSITMQCSFKTSYWGKHAFFDIRKPERMKELIPREKSLQSYPAFLIGRLGVSAEFAGQGIGSQLMRYVKSYCLNQFPHLGRFLVVDAYNVPEVLDYYLKNEFIFVFSTEQQEKENLKKAPDDVTPLRTRQMFYDMMRWRKSM